MLIDAPRSLSAFLVVEEDYAVYRPNAMVSLAEFFKMGDAVVRYCVEHKIRHLLFDATGVTGFRPPSLVDRYEGIVRLAEIAGGKMRIAEIDRPEQLDPTETNVVIARNRGLELKVFTEEKEAIEWLLG